MRPLCDLCGHRKLGPTWEDALATFRSTQTVVAPNVDFLSLSECSPFQSCGFIYVAWLSENDELEKDVRVHKQALSLRPKRDLNLES